MVQSSTMAIYLLCIFSENANGCNKFLENPQTKWIGVYCGICEFFARGIR